MPVRTRLLLGLTLLLIAMTPLAMMALFLTPAPAAEQVLRAYRRACLTWSRVLAHE